MNAVSHHDRLTWKQSRVRILLLLISTELIYTFGQTLMSALRKVISVQPMNHCREVDHRSLAAMAECVP